jgi:predicted transcriptional regulator
VASKSSRAVALMAIHPKYVQKILTGDKRVEFRKTRFASTISHVVIYATNPIQRVVGFFKVRGIEQATPAELWRRHRHHGGIAQDSFLAYYGKRETGVAIKVGEVFGLRQPRPLSDLGNDVVPPQSFRYLPSNIVDQLTATATACVRTKT